MRVAVTGGTGCLGRPLIDRLIGLGFDIQLLALPQDPAIGSLGNSVHITIADLNTPHALKSLTEDCEIVFHLAGKVHSIPKTKAKEQDFYTVNAEGTRLLLEAANVNKVKRVVFYSTVGVYGRDADFHGDELSLCRPISVYAKSKYQAEQFVLNSSNNGGPEGVVLRFPVVYGPLDRGNVASLINAIHNKYFFYFGDGKALRSMISSRNAAEAALKAGLAPRAANRVFCVTDGQDYTIQEVVVCVSRALNFKWRPFHIPISIAEAIGEVGDIFQRLASIPVPINSDKVRKLSRPLTFSCERAKLELGYEPKETLMEGICREVEWLQKTQGWE